MEAGPLKPREDSSAAGVGTISQRSMSSLLYDFFMNPAPPLKMINCRVVPIRSKPRGRKIVYCTMVVPSNNQEPYDKSDARGNLKFSPWNKNVVFISSTVMTFEYCGGGGVILNDNHHQKSAMG